MSSPEQMVSVPYRTRPGNVTELFEPAVSSPARP